ncbi:hypothetical protein L540_09265 [Bordetella pseudohinzii]|nr:hypothetical protein L540_09265 [Bordetella pseudohinzii]
MALARPAGPPPTTTTSYSIDSRSDICKAPPISVPLPREVSSKIRRLYCSWRQAAAANRERRKMNSRSTVWTA